MMIEHKEITDIISPDVNFVADVENMVKHGAGYFEAILEWCFRKGIEQDQIVPLIKGNKAFQLKLQEEAAELHFLKKKKLRKRK